MVGATIDPSDVNNWCAVAERQRLIKRKIFYLLSYSQFLWIFQVKGCLSVNWSYCCGMYDFNPVYFSMFPSPHAWSWLNLVIRYQCFTCGFEGHAFWNMVYILIVNEFKSYFFQCWESFSIILQTTYYFFFLCLCQNITLLMEEQNIFSC